MWSTFRASFLSIFRSGFWFLQLKSDCFRRLTRVPDSSFPFSASTSTLLLERLTSLAHSVPEEKDASSDLSVGNALPDALPTDAQEEEGPQLTRLSTREKCCRWCRPSRIVSGTFLLLSPSSSWQTIYMVVKEGETSSMCLFCLWSTAQCKMSSCG